MNPIIKKTSALIVLVAILFACESKTKSAAVEAEIIALAKERSKAVVQSDTATLSRILSKDFTYINIWGEHLTRKDYLANNASLGNGSKWIAQDMDSIRVKVYPSFAIITFRVNDRFNYEGQFQSNFCRSTFVYRLENGN